MKKTTAVWLITATLLILIGCALFAGVMTVQKWDFTKLSTVKFVNNNHEISEKFNKISVNTDTADLIFALSDDGKCRVECLEEENAKHSVYIEEDTLIIKVSDQRTWRDRIGIMMRSPKVKVYLPKSEYSSLFINQSTGDIDISNDFKFESVEISLETGDVNLKASASESIRIKTSTGDISVKNITAKEINLTASTGKTTVSDVSCTGDISIKSSTGKISLTDTECKNLTSSASTGKTYLTRVTASEKLTVNASTGDVIFDNSDAAEIYVQTSTGDVTGVLSTDKVFVTDTDTGKIEVPKTQNGGRCEITTNTGDIKIKVNKS